MFAILFCTVIGFIAGLIYVIRRRKISIGKILVAAFLGLAAWGVFSFLKDLYKTQNKKRYF